MIVGGSVTRTPLKVSYPAVGVSAAPNCGAKLSEALGMGATTPVSWRPQIGQPFRVQRDVQGRRASIRSSMMRKPAIS